MRGLAPIVIAVVMVTRGALAQPTPSPPEATKLFEEGRELAKQGKFELACERFTKSLALDPAPGTKLNLGDCLEQQGQLRKAWLMFEEAARDWDRLKDSRAKFSRERANSASSRLATLVIKIADPELAGLELRVGDRPVLPNAEVVERIDPGSIEIVVSAPGRETFEARPNAKPGRTVVIDVPALEAAGTGDGDDTGDRRPPDGQISDAGTTRRKRSRVALAGVTGGFGLVALVVSGVFALDARTKRDEAFMLGCVELGGELMCPPAGAAAAEAAGTQADRATYFGIGGVVLVAAGVVLFVTAPRETVTVTPVASAESVGIIVGGRF